MFNYNKKELVIDSTPLKRYILVCCPKNIQTCIHVCISAKHKQRVEVFENEN